MTQAERDFGTILINSKSSPQRRRYSLAHELGHFLCAWHRPAEGGFRCTVIDMTEPGGSAIHRRQEMEANRFAIELLAPKRLVRRHLRRFPDLDDVLALHTMLDISKAAAVRRYVALHPKEALPSFSPGTGRFSISSEATASRGSTSGRATACRHCRASPVTCGRPKWSRRTPKNGSGRPGAANCPFRSCRKRTNTP